MYVEDPIYWVKVKETKYDRIINKSAEKYQVSPQIIKKMILLESDFDPNKYNKSSQARGLLQITPLTMKNFDIETYKKKGVFELTKPEYNIELGTRIFRSYYDRIEKKGITNNQSYLFKLSLASYYAGPGNVWKWLRNAGNRLTIFFTNLPFLTKNHLLKYDTISPKKYGNIISSTQGV